MLDQGLADYDSPARQLWPAAYFCNNVLLEHSLAYWFTCGL